MPATMISVRIKKNEYVLASKNLISGIKIRDATAATTIKTVKQNALQRAPPAIDAQWRGLDIV